MASDDSDRPASGHGETDTLNLRYMLRAYETTDCARLATLLAAASGDVVNRADVAAAWATRWPRNATQTGRQGIRARITDALSLLKTAGIAHADGPDIAVADPGQLSMVAGNLDVLTDQDGVSVPPSEWARRPAVPVVLRPVQDALEARRELSSPRNDVRRSSSVPTSRTRYGSFPGP